MSSSIRIQLCLLLATVSCFALPPGDKANGITSSCRFGQYDLCPLFQRPRVMIIDSPQRSYRAQRRYRLDFWATDDHSQCPKGTWLCITETNRARTKAIAVPRFFLADDGAIHLQSPSVSAFDVDIRLVCDPDGLSMIPRFTSESSGTHIFTWASRHACPVAALNVLDTQPDDTPANPEADDGDGNEDNGAESDLLAPQKSRKVISWIMVSTGGCLALIAFVVYLYGSSLKVWSLRCLEMLSHSSIWHLPTRRRKDERADEFALIQWAEEDMALEGEEDFMVNGESEHIPLTSVKGKRLQSYGALANIW